MLLIQASTKLLVLRATCQRILIIKFEIVLVKFPSFLIKLEGTSWAGRARPHCIYLIGGIRVLVIGYNQEDILKERVKQNTPLLIGPFNNKSFNSLDEVSCNMSANQKCSLITVGIGHFLFCSLLKYLSMDTRLRGGNIR